MATRSTTPAWRIPWTERGTWWATDYWFTKRHRVGCDWSNLSMYFCCSVARSYLTVCNPMDCSMPGFPVLHQLPEFPQIHVHRVGDAIQPAHTLLSPSPPAFSLFQHLGLFQWISSSHQVAKVLELQLQLQSFQWLSFRTDWFDLPAVQGTLKSLLQHHEN